jgi:hypothetical protein
VSKNGLILTSVVVGAIPGALLTFMMVMAFVNYAGGPFILHKILCVAALLIGLLLMAMPVGIFVLDGPKSEKAPAKKKDKDEDAVVEDDAVVAEDDAVVEDAGVVTDDNLVVEDTATGDFAMTGEIVTDDSSAGEEFAEAEEDFVEVEEEEDDAPKKGKKKK